MASNTTNVKVIQGNVVEFPSETTSFLLSSYIFNPKFITAICNPINAIINNPRMIVNIADIFFKIGIIFGFEV